MEGTDEWMRRRIRMVFWKKRKRVRTRYRNLRKLGASTTNTGILANTGKGYWRTASSPILNAALSNERNESGQFGFVKYDFRTLHNKLYYEDRKDQKEEDPWA